MGERELFGQSRVAGHIANLLERVRVLEKSARKKDREELLDGSEIGQTTAGDNTGFNTFFYHPCIATTIDANSRLFSARRAVPDASSLWIADPDLTRAITITVPFNASMPTEGDVVFAMFTGVYSIAGGPQVRYGMAAGADTAQRVRLDANRADGNILDCSVLNQAGTVVTTVAVARAPDLQKTFFNGNVIAGVTYTSVTKDTRTAKKGGDTETHKVTPDYVEGKSILIISSMPQGTGLTNSGQPVVWQDITPGRAWAVE